MKNFVKTKDTETANTLRCSGLTEVGKEGDFFVFLNQPQKYNFEATDKKKVVFSDMVCLAK